MTVGILWMLLKWLSHWWMWLSMLYTAAEYISAPGDTFSSFSKLFKSFSQSWLLIGQHFKFLPWLCRGLWKFGCQIVESLARLFLMIGCTHGNSKHNFSGSAECISDLVTNESTAEGKQYLGNVFCFNLAMKWKDKRWKLWDYLLGFFFFLNKFYSDSV